MTFAVVDIRIVTSQAISHVITCSPIPSWLLCLVSFYTPKPQPPYLYLHMKTTALLLSLLTMLCLVACWRCELGWWILPMILLLAWLIMAFRATMVAWITVLVLLTFAGNRRRVLVRRGGLITGEVTSYFLPLIFKRKSFFALACAALLSYFAALRWTITKYLYNCMRLSFFLLFFIIHTFIVYNIYIHIHIYHIIMLWSVETDGEMCFF